MTACDLPISDWSSDVFSSDLNLGRFYSSPGMVSESFTLFKATNLTKTGPGGGTPDENIAVHRVPLENISDYIDARRGEGMALDVKLLLIMACSFLRDRKSVV